MTHMFTIFGASGNTGSVVASELLARGKKVRVVGRDPARLAELVERGAELFQGDVLDPASVAAALEGSEGAFLLLPPDPTTEDLVARNRRIVDTYVAALTKSSVRHAVLLSSIGAQEPSGTGPIVTVHYAEKALAGVPSTVFTFVRAAYFMENILGFAHAMKTDGVVPVFGGGEAHAFDMVATRDIALVAADALTAPPVATEIIELTGPAAYSFADAAAEASKILGRPIKPVPLPLDAMVPTLMSFGMSANFAGLTREVSEGFSAGRIRFDGKGRALRGKTTLAEVLGAGLG
jgi:uncharacterized protein YbjT (DUF2867 family)